LDLPNGLNELNDWSMRVERSNRSKILAAVANNKANNPISKSNSYFKMTLRFSCQTPIGSQILHNRADFNMFGAENVGELMDQGHGVIIKVREFGCAAKDLVGGGDHVIPQTDSAIADTVRPGATGGQVTVDGFGGEGDDEIEGTVIFSVGKSCFSFTRSPTVEGIRSRAGQAVALTVTNRILNSRSK
jgi:hypothetical protein